MLLGLLLGVVAVVAGSIASITGFGIGSLLTPTLALETGTKLAVAAIAVPHFVGSAVRFWMLRHYVDRRLLFGFGIASAVGGLSGALLQTQLSSRELSRVFGVLVGLAGISELTGWIQRVHWGTRAAWVAGIVSGALGGLVGNQGGIRSAALLGFRVPKESFVATATAIGLMVDTARLLVYLPTQGNEMLQTWSLIAVATLGVIAGTIAGTRILGRIEEYTFRRFLAVLLILLGVYMIILGGQ